MKNGSTVRGSQYRGVYVGDGGVCVQQFDTFINKSGGTIHAANSAKEGKVACI
jgi:hypothetical protein